MPLEILAEDRTRGLVRRADPHVGLERDDAGRQAREDHLELAPLALDLLLARARFLARLREPLSHVVERVDEEADLVAGRRRHSRREVAARDGARALHQQLNRHDEPAREVERAVDGREQRDQEHEAQRQRKRGFQSGADVRQLRELVVACLHRVRERGELLIDGKHALHELELASALGVASGAAAMIW